MVRPAVFSYIENHLSLCLNDQRCINEVFGTFTGEERMMIIVPNDAVSNDPTLADEVFKITTNYQGSFEIPETAMLRQIFDSNDNSLLKRIINGETTFAETLRPLIEEHNQLGAFSVLGDSCMTEDFISLGKKIKEETKGLMSTEYLVSFPAASTVCDITKPFSRANLINEALFKFRHILGFSLAMFVLIFYFNFFGNDYGHLINLDLMEITMLNMILTFVPLFCLVLFASYRLELRLRLMICDYVWCQAVKMDDIVSKIFLKK